MEVTLSPQIAAAILAITASIIGYFIRRTLQRIRSIEDRLDDKDERIDDISEKVDTLFGWAFGSPADPADRGLSQDIDDSLDDVDTRLDDLDERIGDVEDTLVHENNQIDRDEFDD